MLSKIYLGLIALAFLVASGFTYFGYSWLQSIGDPKIAAENFQNVSGWNWTYIWISFLVLLLFSNLIIWREKVTWPIWSALAYFAVFIILNTFWLEQSFLTFKKTNELGDQVISISPMIGILVILVVAMAVFFNQYLIKRLLEKIVGNDIPIKESKTEDSEK
jgi:hypothetical protein